MEKRYLPVFDCLKVSLLIITVGLFCFNSYGQTLNVSGTQTITANDTIRVDNVTYASNDSHLIVNGTLIVKNDLLINTNKSSFTMGANARVIVYGDFLTDNQVGITIAGYLFVYGNFEKGGSSNQDIIIIEQGKIYILGTANSWGNEFQSCGGAYDGTTSALDENCDFGNEDDFVNNQDQFPDDLVDLVNCYDLSDIDDQQVCEGQPAVFQVAPLTNVTYQWQEKIGDADWENIVGSTSYSLSLQNTSIADDGKLYRVVVRPDASATSECKISISRDVTLNVLPAGVWTGEVDTDWNNAENWSCNSLPTLNTNVTIPKNLTNYPVVCAGNAALAKDLSIESGALVIVDNNWLRISGSLLNQGILNAQLGGISFQGSAIQTILAGAFDSQILNLNLNNPAGVINNNSIEILNSLKVESGIFQTGDKLLLISNETRTAYIDGSGAGQVEGKVHMQRYLINSFGYKYFSTPFSTSVVNDLIPFFDLTDPVTGFPHLYEYIEDRKNSSGEDVTGWQKFIDPAAAFAPAGGYAVNFSGTNSRLTIEISGEVNDGDLSINLENTNGTYTNGFNLVGNPYPSPIDWDLMVPSLQGIDNAVYFFTASPVDRYTGTYTAYVDGISTDGRSSNIIASMQGFFVRVSDPLYGNYPATGTLEFTNSSRVGNRVAHNYHQVNTRSKVPQIKISAGYKGNENLDALVLYFNKDATPGFERSYDAQKMLNTAIDVPNLYSLSSKAEKLAINAIPPIASKMVEIPLGITAPATGEMFLTLNEVSNTSPTLHIYLKDRKNKVLKEFHENNSYSFTSQKGGNDDRFSLLLTSENLSEEQKALATEYFSVYTLDKEIIVKLNLMTNSEAKVTINNLSGQVLQTKKGKGTEELIFTGSFVEGIYLVTFETEKERYTRKILFKD